MMPDNELSSTPLASEFLTPLRNDPLIDFEWGGIDIQNTSQGLIFKIWKCFYENGYIKITDGDLIYSLIDAENITALSLAFDLNMRPIVTYFANGHCYLWWFDSQEAAQITTDFGSAFSFPQLALDDKRSSQSANADVIFAYIKNKKLYMRIQRERFQIEHEITQAKRLIQIGMMKNYRFGFAYYNWD